MDESETWYHFYVHAIGAFLFCRTGAAQENVGMPPQGALGTVAQLPGVP